MTRSELMDICLEWAKDDSRHIMVIAVEETADMTDEVSVLTNCNPLKMGACIAGAIHSNKDTQSQLKDIIKFVKMFNDSLEKNQTNKNTSNTLKS